MNSVNMSGFKCYCAACTIYLTMFNWPMMQAIMRGVNSLVLVSPLRPSIIRQFMFKNLGLLQLRASFKK